jgi:hypothetical protein
MCNITVTYVVCFFVSCLAFYFNLHTDEQACCPHVAAPVDMRAVRCRVPHAALDEQTPPACFWVCYVSLRVSDFWRASQQQSIPRRCLPCRQTVSALRCNIGLDRLRACNLLFSGTHGKLAGAWSYHSPNIYCQTRMRVSTSSLCGDEVFTVRH